MPGSHNQTQPLAAAPRASCGGGGREPGLTGACLVCERCRTRAAACTGAAPESGCQQQPSTTGLTLQSQGPPELLRRVDGRGFRTEMLLEMLPVASVAEAVP